MKFNILILFCVLSMTLTAQTNEEAKTIFGGSKPHLGYFVSPFVQVGKIAGSTAVLPGINAGVIFNNRLTVGASYKFIITENTPVGEADDRLYLDQFYAGLKVEYSIFPTKPVHLNLFLETGLGHTELDLKDAYEFDHFEGSGTNASFFYAEPGAAIELNLWKYLKLDIGAGYRFASAVTYRSITEKNIMGFSFSGGLKIGLF